MEYLIETSFSLALFINAMLFIPQAIKLLKNKNSEGVSFITFFGFWLIQLTTFLHGLIKNDFLLAYGTLISMVTCGYVVLLLLYYKSKNTRA